MPIKRKHLTSRGTSPEEEEEEETVKKQKRVSFSLQDNEPKQDDQNLTSQLLELAASTDKQSPKKKGKKKKTPGAMKSTDFSSSPSTKRETALSYLQLWHTDRINWSFKKRQQLWLLQNLYDKAQMNKKSFKQLVGYVEGLQGAQRNRMVEEAKTKVENYKPSQEEEEGTTEERVLQYQYNRAVELLRVLA